MVTGLVLAQDPPQMILLQARVRSRSSRRHPPIQCSAIAFIRRVRMVQRTVRNPASAKDGTEGAGEVRSAVADHECDPISLLAEAMSRSGPAGWSSPLLGCGVTPRIRMRRVACSITASTARFRRISGAGCSRPRSSPRCWNTAGRCRRPRAGTSASRPPPGATSSTCCQQCRRQARRPLSRQRTPPRSI